MKYTFKHALMLTLGLTLGFGTLAFTDILHPVGPFIPGSLVLSPDQPLPETMRWIDPQFGFDTRHPTGLLEVRWYCAYEGMSGLALEALPVASFSPLVTIEPPQPPAQGDDEAFYYELTRTQLDSCPTFRLGPLYPAG